MKKHLLFLFIYIASIGATMAQSPGLIVRPAGGSGSTPLNPNGDGFSSSSTSGFISNDVTESEVAYKIVPPVFLEPTSDLMRGPNELYSDLVRQVDGSGFYVFNTGINLLFRLRIGNIVSGSKGYSILIDTDGKIGNTGPYADPNYQAATTGVNGNPGFELEVVLETNFRVAVYNVDGTSTPSLLNSYGINTNSQISVALSTVSSTPDYFYDFYVPVSALGISASTPLRMTATTVMAPTAAIGGPKSDIFGVSDTDPMKSWEKVISNTSSFTLDDIKSTGSGVSAVCTAAPTLTSPIQAGSGISVSGTWTALDVSKPSSATITLYKNGVSAGTTTVTSGNTWTITGITVSAGDILYAKAQAVGESQCLQSNNVKVISCTAANTSTTVGLSNTCTPSDRGMEGSRPANATIKIYQVTSTGITLYADDNSTTYRVTYPASGTWRFDGQNGQGASSACSGGAPDIPDGSYMITATESGKCESAGVYVCVTYSAATTPTITQTNLYAGATTLSGTSAASALVRLYNNGKLETTTTANGSGNYSFTGLALQSGDVVSITAQTAGACISSSVSRTVTCFTTPPVINTDNNGNLSTGATTITGKSYEAAGAIVTVLENAVSIGTATVQANGTWSLTYTPVATRSYTATQQNGSCAASTASTAATALAATTVCPSITGSYTAGASSVTGTLPSSFTGTIRLYIDGISIGSVAVTSATTWSISVNTSYSNTLYPGGVLTVTSQAASSAEKTDCSSSVTVSCATPATPVISPTSSNINVGQAVTFTVTSAQSGIIYSVTGASAFTTNYAISKFGTGSNLSLPSNTFNSAGVYNVNVNAISLSGAGCLTSTAASISVAGALPVTLMYFTGYYVNDQTQLDWETATEENVEYFSVERSDDGRQFTEIGRVAAKGNSTASIKYTYTDHKAVTNTAWYRLRTVDNDLQWKYSNVVRITNAINSLRVQSVAPNPFENQLQLQVYTDKPMLTQVRISDMTGREVYSTNNMLSTGNNTMRISSLGSLSKGVYLLQLLHQHEVVYKQQVQKIR
jgi:hypothetical protein